MVRMRHHFPELRHQLVSADEGSVKIFGNQPSGYKARSLRASIVHHNLKYLAQYRGATAATRRQSKDKGGCNELGSSRSFHWASQRRIQIEGAMDACRQAPFQAGDASELRATKLRAQNVIILRRNSVRGLRNACRVRQGGWLRQKTLVINRPGTKPGH